MKKTTLKKRIISLILATILCMGSSLTVFAASNVPTTSAVEPRAIGDCIASDGVITGGYDAEFSVYLDRSYFDIYIRAGATGNSNNAVACYVTFPDNSTYFLGYVIADGSKTSYLAYDGTAPAGYYTFHFEGTDEGTTGFLGFIYKSN